MARGELLDVVEDERRVRGNIAAVLADKDMWLTPAYSLAPPQAIRTKRGQMRKAALTVG